MSTTDVPEQELRSEQGVEDPISKKVFDSLDREFLGPRLTGVPKNHPEREFSQIQTFKDGERVKSDPELMAQLAASDLWSDVEALRAREFTSEEVRLIVNFCDALNKIPDVTEDIVTGIFAFQRERMKQLNVPDYANNIAIDHEIGVTNIVRNPGSGPAEGLFIIASSMHDNVKYVGVYDNAQEKYVKKVELGLHEAASAIMADRYMRQILSIGTLRDTLGYSADDDWQKTINAVSAYVSVIIANHGYGEFPHRMAEDNVIDRTNGVYKLFGSQIYIDNYKPIAKRVDSRIASSAEVKRLERMSEGMQAADKIYGMFLTSYEKFHSDENPAAFLRRGSSSKYIGSFFQNYDIDYAMAPPDFDFKHNPEVMAEKTRNELMFAFVFAEDKDSATRTSFYETSTGALGEEIAKRLREHVSKMREIFAQGVAGSLNALECRDEHAKAMTNYFDIIRTIDTSLITSSEMQSAMSSILPGMTE